MKHISSIVWYQSNCCSTNRNAHGYCSLIEAMACAINTLNVVSLQLTPTILTPYASETCADQWPSCRRVWGLCLAYMSTSSTHFTVLFAEFVMVNWTTLTSQGFNTLWNCSQGKWISFCCWRVVTSNKILTRLTLWSLPVLHEQSINHISQKAVSSPDLIRHMSHWFWVWDRDCKFYVQCMIETKFVVIAYFDRIIKSKEI